VPAIMAAGAAVGPVRRACGPPARSMFPGPSWAATSRESPTELSSKSSSRVLRFGSSYASIADRACGATTIRDRRDE
jgi:hypothetical protein